MERNILVWRGKLCFSFGARISWFPVCFRISCAFRLKSLWWVC